MTKKASNEWFELELLSFIPNEFISESYHMGLKWVFAEDFGNYVDTRYFLCGRL